MDRAALVFALLLLAACAGPASMVGGSEAELRARMGAPAGEYPNADGSRINAYTLGAQGGVAYMADIAANGTVRSVRQALGEETFQRINPGMTRDEVLRLIGPPGDSMDFPNLGELSWEYFFVDTWGYGALFFVNFDRRGIVVGKFTRRLQIDQAGDR